MNELYYATSNAVKFQEAQSFFSSNVSEITLKQDATDLVEIQSLDQKEIAIDKARQAWQQLQKPVLAEDAGIYFEKYNQFPGTLTKHVYQGIGIKNIFKLIEPHERVFFQIHLVYYYGPDQYEVFTGYCPGTVILPDVFCASTSTPFDDIFMPEGSGKTYQELRVANELAQYNYRAQALQKFIVWYRER